MVTEVSDGTVPAKVCCEAQSAVEMRILVILSRRSKVAEVISTGAGRSKLGPQTQNLEKQRMGQAGQGW